MKRELPRYVYRQRNGLVDAFEKAGHKVYAHKVHASGAVELVLKPGAGFDDPFDVDLTRERKPKPQRDYHVGRYVPRKVRDAVFNRDGHRCRYCGKTGQGMHLEHIVPRSRGGLNVEDNLGVACRECNQSKGGKTVEEWRT